MSGEIDSEYCSGDVERKAILEKELVASKYMQKSSLLEFELEKTKKQLEKYISDNKELVKSNIYYENESIKYKEQLLNLKQTMSYRLGHSLIFGFKSWKGFKNLLSMISLLRKEKKGIVQKKRIYLERQSLKNKLPVKLINAKSVTLRKYSQFWESDINDIDAFKFRKYLVAKSINKASNFLSKDGVNFSIETDLVDSIIVRISLKAVEPIYADKQAILTIDYIDINGQSLTAVLDTPYSSSLKKYYHYLTVNPDRHNNIILCPPNGTHSITLNVRLWDNVTDIIFDGLFQTASHKTGVSVIVPSYRGEKTVIRCLESLVHQTLDYNSFEVIIALNGERDSTRQKIDKYLKKHPQFNMNILELDGVGASYARNEAIKVVKFSHVTFVDDDDYVDENYLKNLFAKARYGNITLTGVKDIHEGTKGINKSPITTQLVRASEKKQIAYHDVTSVLTMNACKMAPTHMIKSVLYNSNLKSGEDVAYWTKLLSLFNPVLDISDEPNQAVYYRVITKNSVSRQQESYDFNVSQRLDVIEDLIKLLDILDSDASFIQSKITAQSNFIKRYLSKNSKDYQRFRNEIIERDISNSFVGSINELFTECLVISYCFAPYADTSAVVMGKRINQMDAPVDVISNSMSNVRSKDSSLHKLSSFNIGKHIELNAPQAFSNWNAIAQFAELVVREIGNIISQRGMYKQIYSRAMWPASHFAAALVKMKYPQVQWIAEFSDPLLMDVTANERYEALSIEWLKKHSLVSGSKEELNDNLFYWCEKLVYDFADEIIFTNKNQQEYMLSYADTNTSIIRNKSKILPQPTLDERYYNFSNAVLDREDDITYIGYFGSFYVNRGFDAFFEAWNNLTTELQSKIRLHVYTQQDKEVILEKAPEALEKYIVVSPYVEYFDFLSLSKQFDVLLVADTKTEGIKLNNPYLPSKISDYLGSNTKIIALVEHNSPVFSFIKGNIVKILFNDVVHIKKELEEKIKL